MDGGRRIGTELEVTSRADNQSTLGFDGQGIRQGGERQGRKVYGNLSRWPEILQSEPPSRENVASCTHITTRYGDVYQKRAASYITTTVGKHRFPNWGVYYIWRSAKPVKV